MDPAQRMLLETAYRALENGKFSSRRICGYFSYIMSDEAQLESLLSMWQVPTRPSSPVP